MSRIRTEFFDKDADKLRAKDYIEFLSCNEKFGLNCGRKHCPTVERWDTPGMSLEDEFDAENQPAEIPEHVLERIRFAQFRKTLLDRDY